MKKHYILLLFLLINGIAVVCAQEIPLKHKIIKGETIELIAQKYAISASDLYTLNPTLRDGFKVNDVIIISKTENSQSAPSIVYHLVQANETKFGLAKKYNISILELERQNPQIVPMLQKDHKLKIKYTVSKNSSEKRDTNDSSQNGELGTYQVKKGETLYWIAKRYKITLAELIEENKAELGTYLQIGQILKIPLKNKQTETNTANVNYQTHLVVAGETKYGLAKKYQVSIRDLEDQNPQIVAMLRTGQEISIPAAPVTQNTIVQKTTTKVSQAITEKGEVVDNESKTNQLYIVESGETKIGLAKRFSLTVAELERLNPQIVEMLQAGQQIQIPAQSIVNQEQPTATIAETKSAILGNTAQPKAISDVDSKPKNLVSYEVKPQETLYGLSKMAGLSQEQLIAINPELSSGVRAGMILNIPSQSDTAIAKAPTLTTATQKDLRNAIQKNVLKDVAFLAPFSEEQYLAHLKAPMNATDLKSNFDFYAGAAMAIDSLRKMDVLVGSTLLKLQEVKQGEVDVSELISKNIQKYAAVFSIPNDYNLEELGNYLAKDTIPLVVATSKTKLTAHSTFISAPSKTNLNKLVLDYLVSKNENLIIVNEPSRVESKDYIAAYYPQAQFVQFNKSGNLNKESLQNLLSVTKKNYVVLDTEEAGLILATTTALLKVLNTYDLQIALLEPKEVLKGEGLSDIRFRALKMIHPSIYKPSDINDLNNFKKNFARRYNFEANQDAIKGFDVTFDALVRLFQDNVVDVLVNQTTTEQINFKFKYVKNVEGGYYNSGGYILQFDEETNNKIIN
jgi:LysM repeat protein